MLEQFPEPNATLPIAPAEVRLRFNEAVTSVTVRVLDTQGRTLTRSDAISEMDTTVDLRLRRRLAVRTYLVTYRVISADSHPAGGSCAFAVGTCLSASRPSLLSCTHRPASRLLINNCGRLILAAANKPRPFHPKWVRPSAHFSPRVAAGGWYC